MIYEFTIQYVTIDEKGNDKTVKETYATEKFNFFSEVEAFALEEFAFCKAIDVIAIKRSAVKEIANRLNDLNDLVWEATVQQSTTIDDVEKIMKYRMLLFAPSFDAAKTFIGQYMQQGYGDMELVGLKQTKIKDIFL